MSINNLHSLINGRWFIDEAYGRSLLPSLHSILRGNTNSVKKEDRKPDAFILMRGASPQNAASFDNNQNAQDYILVIDMKDPIYKYSQECGPQGTKSKMRTMESYKSDSFCKGIVLDIDSGGGQVSGTPEFYDYVSNYGKPVVAYTDGYMCSAAYYIGAASSFIVANKRAEHIGSIGTMIHFIDMTGFYEKEGAKVITEYATKSKDKNRDFEDLISGNPEGYIKNQLDPITENFIADIKAVRSSISEEVFSGKTYNASDSLSKGLIDEIGTLQTAIDKVFELSKTSNQNSNNMSTQRANVQAVLGLDAPLASTEENGSYLNQEQLDQLESRLETLGSENSALQTQLTEAKANPELKTKLTAAETSLTGIEATVETMLSDAGLTATGTLKEKLTALSAHVVELGNKDGDKPTNVKIDKSGSQSLNSNIVGGVDVSAALNN